MHIAPLIHDLALILGVAALVTIVFRRIHQPVVLGYLIAGLLIGPHLFPEKRIIDMPSVKVWAELGVIFLMFALGLEFSFRKLSRVGISASLTAWIEVPLMMLLGFVTGKLLKWSFTDSVFLGGMLGISSTSIIVRALDGLKLKTRRFAELIFGVLIVEDLMAVLLLVGLSTFAASHDLSGLVVLASAGKLLLVVGSWFVVGYFVVPRFVRYVARVGSDEMLTVLSVALCLILAAAAASFQYSVALGAFIMGSILAESTESNRILELVEPLRDLFAAVFFVSVGMMIDPRLVQGHWGELAVITTVLLLGKIVCVTIGVLVTGQTFRTAVQVGFGMAQIGEFSFIIVGMGVAMGVVRPVLYPIAVAVSLVTTFTTPYLIRISHRFAVWFERRLPLRLRDTLTQYSVWTQERTATGTERRNFYRRSLRWLLNGIVITVMFVLVAEIVSPWIAVLAKSARVGQLLGFSAAICFSAPFVWGMMTAFRGFTLGPGAGGTLLLSRLAGVVWIGILSVEFFSLRNAFFIVAGLLLGFFVIFRSRIAVAYRWFENNFVANFSSQPKSRRPTDMLRHLAPWDAHLVRFKVHPNSEVAGKLLSEVKLRENHGLSVVVIQRGLNTIVAPGPTERIYPKDELLVLGTDEQVEGARRAIEKPPGLGERFRDLSGYELRKIQVTARSHMNGLAIREAGIREKLGGMVVGIERDDLRTINPSSSMVLREGDLLWIVGDVEKNGS